MVEWIFVATDSSYIGKDYDEKTKLYKRMDCVKTNNIPNLNACINYVFHVKEIDKIIIGVKNLKQIKQIFKAIENKSTLYPKNLFSDDYNLINPMKWKIR